METVLHGSAVLKLDDIELTLLPEHAVWWQDRQTLFVADLHFGKEASFRARGIPIPDVVCRDLKRLDDLIHRTHCERLIILGDLLHARSGRSPELIEQVANWRRNHETIDLVLILGNHDRHAGKPPSAWGISCEEEPFEFHALRLVHHPDFSDSPPTLAGHLHPKFQLHGPAERLNLPGFLLRNKTLVLPAFSSFIDHGLVKLHDGDHLFVVAEQQVFSFKRS